MAFCPKKPHKRQKATQGTCTISDLLSYSMSILYGKLSV